MSKFPTTELEIIELATNVKTGLTAQVGIYPEPPVSPTELGTMITTLQTMMTQAATAKAAAETATASKVEALEGLVALLKKDLRYAENTVNGDDTKLKLIGWSGRKDPTPVALPGQPGLLVVYPQGEGWLELEWQTPVDGGKVADYRVQRRLRTETAWTQIATTYQKAITLSNQPRGVELEYCVLASNRTGDGPISNTVLVVL